MGPGYFPILLGTVLGGLGLILVVRSFLTHGERLTRLHLVPVAIMTLGVCLFGVFIERLGLVISLIVVTMVTALASREFAPARIHRARARPDRLFGRHLRLRAAAAAADLAGTLGRAGGLVFQHRTRL